MLRESLQQRLRNAAIESGHEAAIEFLLAEARECVYVLPDGEPDEDLVGGSRIGGRPDLDDSIEWPPGIDGKSAEPFGFASFIAQFNLTDIPKIDGLVLPDHGLLSVFLRDVRGVPITLIYQPEPGRKVRRRLAPPDLDEEENLWAIDDDSGEDVIQEPRNVRFEVGITLRYRRADFEDSLDEQCAGANNMRKLEKLLKPKACLARIGGFAFDDHRKDYMDNLVRADGETVLLESGPLLVLCAINLHDIGNGVGMWVFMREKDLAAGDFSRPRSWGSMAPVA